MKELENENNGVLGEHKGDLGCVRRRLMCEAEGVVRIQITQGFICCSH